MPGTFFGIEIGQRGLMAAQVGQDTTGHNIANADTPGYSVQSVQMKVTDPFTNPAQSDTVHVGMLGTGVEANSITRARDQFLDVQVRDGNSALGLQTSQGNALGLVENAFGEPSSNGLSSAIDNFFSSFQDLTSNPENTGIRASVVQSADAMTRIFKSTQQRLVAVGTQLNNKVNDDMSSLNNYGQQIAALNITIRQATAQGLQANDLMDRRDILLDKISTLANVTVFNKTDGSVNVAIGTSDLVVGTDAFTLTQSGLNARGDLQSGELSGLAIAQTAVTGYQASLDTLAAQTIAAVNAQHAAGSGLDGVSGRDLFTGTNATNIAVNSVISSDPRTLAAAAIPALGQPTPIGDASNAVLIANIKSKVIVGTGTAVDTHTLSGFYQQTVTDAGGRAAAAKTAATSAQVNVTQLTQQRNSVTGVSTDSELANMLKYQRSYEASARVVKTMDDMLGTLINSLFSN